MPLAVALFSGGLDSMLAVRILQEQGFEVEAINIRTPFACCKVPAAQAAIELGIRQTVLGVDDDYVELLRNPRYGRGKATNPCIDCRIHMAKIARRFMERIGASVVISGEVLNQRPMSQKRNDLQVIGLRSGLEGRLLRPLSAKLLAPTIPEREGLVDRDRLYAFHGRGRTRLIELARQLGIRDIPQPSTGCALTEPSFAPRVCDLMEHCPRATMWDFELLNIGRHIRLDEHAKAVIGRNAMENATLRSFAAREDAGELQRLAPESFVGPDALLVGRIEEASSRLAAALVVHYARRAVANPPARVRVIQGVTTRVIEIESADVDSAVAYLGTL